MIQSRSISDAANQARVEILPNGSNNLRHIDTFLLSGVLRIDEMLTSSFGALYRQHHLSLVNNQVPRSLRLSDAMTRMSSSNRHTRRNSSTNILPLVSAGLALLVLVLFLYAVNANTSSRTTTSKPAERQSVAMGTKRTFESNQLPVVSGSTINNIDYYYCHGSEQHLVLLHGARFTKEDWKTSGILDRFCNVQGLSVSALDLPVSASHVDLQNILNQMQSLKLFTAPVILVTPSASGKTITDWAMNGDVTTLPSYVSKWIPIAAGSINSVTDEQLTTLKDQVPIFAIYGNKDTMGQQVTQRLADLAAADILEIEGGHPCYLDSPDVFVSAVLQNLGLAAT